MVTREDYLYFAGVDLIIELEALSYNDLGDPEQMVDTFIEGVENWVMLQVKKPPYCFSGEFETEHQTTCFKNAVLSQISYILHNGNISNNSGVNDSFVLSNTELDKVRLAPDAKDYLRLGGMMNL